MMKPNAGDDGRSRPDIDERVQHDVAQDVVSLGNRGVRDTQSKSTDEGCPPEPCLARSGDCARASSGEAGHSSHVLMIPCRRPFRRLRVVARRRVSTRRESFRESLSGS